MMKKMIFQRIPRGSGISKNVLVSLEKKAGLILLMFYFLLFLKPQASYSCGPWVWKANHLWGNTFWMFSGLVAVKLFLDPVWTALLRLLLRPRTLLTYAVFCVGACAVGLSVWSYNNPGQWARLITRIPLAHSDFQSLKYHCTFFLVLCHFLWGYVARAQKPVEPENFLPVLRRDAGMLGLAVLGCLVSVSLSLVWRDKHRVLWPFFVWVPLWASMLAVKMGGAGFFWKKLHGSGKGFLYAALFFYVAAFSVLGIRKLDLYLGHGDFPVYLQPLWNTGHGLFMGINWMYTEPGRTLCWFGEHLNLEFLALLPLYALTDGSPRFFIVLQAVWVALAAIPLYRTARHMLDSAGLALALAMAWLLNPLVQRALLFDFHSESLEPFLIFTTFLFAVQNRGWPFFWTSLALMSCKEDAALYVVAFGLYAWLFRKNKTLGYTGIGLGLCWLWLSVGVVIPWMRGQYEYHTWSSRYPMLGSNVHEVVGNVLHHPLMILRLLFDRQTLVDLGYLVFPLAVLPLLHPASWLLIAPSSLEMFLSQFKFMKGIALHYSLFIVPFYFLGALVALHGLLRFPRFRAPGFKQGLAVYFCISSFLFQYLLDPQPPVSKSLMGWYINRSPLGQEFSWDRYRMSSRDRRVRDFVRHQIPAGVSLSTEFRFAHDLSRRSVLRKLPLTDDVDMIFMELYGITAGEAARQKHLRYVFDLLAHPGWGVRHGTEGLLLLQRGIHRESNLKAAQDLVGYHEAEWHSEPIGGVVDYDWRAFNKEALRFTPGVSPANSYIEAGQHRVPPGPLKISFRLRLDGAATNRMAAMGRLRLSAVESNEILVERKITAGDFDANGEYQYFTLAVENPRAQRLSARLIYEQQGDLSADHIRWVCRRWSWEDLLREIKAP